MAWPLSTVLCVGVFVHMVVARIGARAWVHALCLHVTKTVSQIDCGSPAQLTAFVTGGIPHFLLLWEVNLMRSPPSVYSSFKLRLMRSLLKSMRSQERRSAPGGNTAFIQFNAARGAKT
jgi:hypothetical protein